MQKLIQQRKQNWIDFYDLNSSVTRLLTVDYTEGMPKKPLLWWENLKEREEWAYQRYMVQMENMDKLHDNTIPFLPTITGTEIFAEAFGCKVHKPLDNNPCAIPLIQDVSEWHKIKFPKLEDTNLTKLFDLADNLKARAGKDALLGLPDIQTPIDIAALIWDKSDFYIAMFEEESAILELSQKIKEFMFSFFDEWFKRYGTEFIAHYPDYYMPFGITISEDEIGVVNSDMYHKYFEKELHEFAIRYGAIGIHCCADSEHQWENLKQVPNLKLLNLVRNKESTKNALSFFDGVVAQYPATVVDMDDIPNSQNIHCANYIYTDTLKHAIDIADRYNETGKVIIK